MINYFKDLLLTMKEINNNLKVIRSQLEIHSSCITEVTDGRFKKPAIRVKKDLDRY